MFCPVFLPQFQAEHWSNLLLLSVTSSIYIQTQSEAAHQSCLFIDKGRPQAGNDKMDLLYNNFLSKTFKDTIVELTLTPIRFLSSIIWVCSLKPLNIIKTPSIKLNINLGNVVRGKFLHNSRWRPLHQPICFQQNILKNVKVVLSHKSFPSHVC